jgi:hypothetical protein
MFQRFKGESVTIDVHQDRRAVNVTLVYDGEIPNALTSEIVDTEARAVQLFNEKCRSLEFIGFDPAETDL